MYENTELCAECKGECCKVFPGLCIPTDFGRLANRRGRIKKALQSGRYCLERSAVNRWLMVRPAVIGYERVLIDGKHDGNAECTFLRGTGCELSAGKRPYDCRTLEPVISRRGRKFCKDHGMSQDKQIRRWQPYQQMLREIVAEIEAAPSAN